MLSKSKVKYIQSLGQKKFRDEEGLFVAEGPKIVQELILSMPSEVRAVYALKEWIDEHRKLHIQTEVEEISEAELERISQLATPNKVIAIIEKKHEQQLLSANQITLVLDTIQDPGNMGTIIRSADWFGIRQIVCSHDSVDMYNPKVIQATMGSIARVTIQYAEITDWLAKQTVNIYAAALEGTDIRKMNRISEGIIVIGNESKGIHDSVMKLATEKITIPKPGQAESLNAAVATAIILSHIV